MADPRAQTPPPQAHVRLHTPDAPRHGAQFDNNGPLSPRRSRRTTRNPYSTTHNIDTRNGTATTPPPFQSSPPSPPMSPMRTASHRTPASNKYKQPKMGSLQAPITNGLLLTPAKTPKSLTPPSTGVSRRLDFQLADPRHAMPTPRKLKKYSRRGPAAGEDVEIYSDWNARVPTRDESADNPFCGPPTPASRPQQRSRKTTPKPLNANMSKEEMHDRVDNDEGLIFAFRGKQVFRPYLDTVEDPVEATAMGYKLIRRSTRPGRLNFGVQDGTADDVDEEAITDIEADAHVADEVRSSGSQSEVTTADPFKEWARSKSSSLKRESADGAMAGASKRVRNDL